MKAKGKSESSEANKKKDIRAAVIPPRNPNPLFQAHRLEGKARNFGIKNIGPQMKRGKRGDR